jgi:hypothetical protein
MVGMRQPDSEARVGEFATQLSEQQAQLSSFNVRMLFGCFEGIDLEKVFD